jgi:molybdenum ABC transporter molybdate-binding protein
MTGGEYEWMRDWTVGVRLWLERADEAILGPGRVDLLETIDRCHSISAAARQLGMSYRRAWLLVDSMNRAAGCELVRRQTGGREGGGAELTANGRIAIALYRELQTRIRQNAVSTALVPPMGQDRVVHLAVAASLVNVLDSLLADFAVENPNLSVRTLCGASDELAEQMIHGVHVDLFLSAAKEPLDRLEAAGLLASSSRTPFGVNRLSAIASSSEFFSRRDPRSLLQAGVRQIALADPSCPLGRYTRAYLESLDLWEAIRPRAMFLDNPRVVLAAVESAKADVGMVYRSDVHASRSCRILFSTRPDQPSISYTAALTQRGEHSIAARSLLTFLTSPAARKRLQSFGFLKP